MSRPSPIPLGSYTLRALGKPDDGGRYLWRLEWYPDGGKGRMRTHGLGRHPDARAAEAAAHATIPALGVPRHHPGTVDAWGTLLRMAEAQWSRDAAAGLLRPRSLLAYQASVRRLRWHLETTPTPATASALLVQIEGLRDALVRTGLAAATVHLDVAGVAGKAWRWAVARDHVAPLPWPRIALPAVARSGGYVPTDDDVTRIAAWLRAYVTPTGRPAAHGWPAVAVQLWWAVAPRIGELAHLVVGDVDLEARTVTLGAHHAASKTGARVLPVSTATAQLLADYLTERGPLPPEASLWPVTPSTLIASLWSRHVLPACAALSIPAFVAHAGRTALADELAARHVDPRTAADALGHSVEVQLRRYRRPLADDLAAAIEGRATSPRVLTIRRKA